MATGLGALVMWVIVLIQALNRRRAGVERRATWVVMPATAIVVSIGTLASAVAMGQGMLDFVIEGPILTLLASVGRGALFTAAVLVLLAPHPETE
jgi:hypothetical protein